MSPSSESCLPPLVRERYSRQTVLPGFGCAGQMRLSRRDFSLWGDPTAVLTAATYLAAGGVGRVAVGPAPYPSLPQQNDLVTVTAAHAQAEALPSTPQLAPGCVVGHSPHLGGFLFGRYDHGRLELRFQAGLELSAQDLMGSRRAGAGEREPVLSSPCAARRGVSTTDGIGQAILGCLVAGAALVALAAEMPKPVAERSVPQGQWDLEGFEFASRHRGGGRRAEDLRRTPDVCRTPAETGSPAPASAPASGTGRPRRVVVVGAGGLGSGVCWGLALAAAAGGPAADLRLLIADADLVDQSNLPRQVLHRPADLGRPKAASAVDAVRRLAPRLEVRGTRMPVTEGTADALLDQADLVINAVDNYETRYLINDLCLARGLPLVEAGVLRYAGLVMAVPPGGGPCYRCLFPRAPAPGSTPDPAAAGVYGPLAGLAGMLEALFALHLLQGRAAEVEGRLLVLDAECASVRAVSFAPDPRCPACGRGAL